MPSTVYFANLRSETDRDNKITKIQRLFDRAGLGGIVRKNDLTAVKLHFGERGSDAFINPLFVRQVVDKIRGNGAKAFLTDTNTLYSGSRHNAADHILTALEHGFDYTVTGAPVIIADGLRGENVVEVRIDRKHFSRVKLAGDIVRADSMIVMTHVKAHMMAGFGGAIKNLAMGGAPSSGKKEQHEVRIVVDHGKCTGCAKCLSVCPEGAATLRGRKTEIDPAKCIGCGECMSVCPVKAPGIDWETDIAAFIERMTEYGYGVVKAHEGRIGYINFLTSITPDCDCATWSDAPIVPDIGFLASTDPVAIDQASYDLVNRQTGLPNSALTRNFNPGEDKFRGLRPYIDGPLQLRYGEEIGMGSREYELVAI